MKSSDEKAIRDRWRSPFGIEAFGQLELALRRMEYEGHDVSRGDLIEILSGLPRRDEVPTGLDFRGIALQGGVASIDLGGADFSLSTLEFNFVNCDLQGAQFKKARVMGSLSRTLRSASFEEAVIAGCQILNVDLVRASFRNARIRRVRFENCVFAGSDLRGARIERAEFIDCDFRGVTFSETAFSHVFVERPILDDPCTLLQAHVVKPLGSGWPSAV